MKPSISQWNRWKIEIMFWENNMKLSIRYQKILIYDHFHLNFHKKDCNIEFKSVLHQELSFSYRIISYCIISISNCFLSVSCTDFVISPMPSMERKKISEQSWERANVHSHPWDKEAVGVRCIAGKRNELISATLEIFFWLNATLFICSIWSEFTGLISFAQIIWGLSIKILLFGLMELDLPTPVAGTTVVQYNHPQNMSQVCKVCKVSTIWWNHSIKKSEE